jgi:hypothetical protein
MRGKQVALRRTGRHGFVAAVDVAARQDLLREDRARGIAAIAGLQAGVGGLPSAITNVIT